MTTKMQNTHAFVIKKHVKWSVSVLGILTNNLRKRITNEIYMFCMVDSEILWFLLFLSLFDLCLFTYTHKHTGGGLLRTAKTFHWYVPTHRLCARALWTQHNIWKVAKLFNLLLLSFLFPYFLWENVYTFVPWYGAKQYRVCSLGLYSLLAYSISQTHSANNQLQQ